jgi:stage III sporulation protein AB
MILRKKINFGGISMIKIVGCLLILAASTIGGFVFADGFRRRVKQLNELERALNQLQSEIEYTYTPLPEAMYNVATKSDAPINQIFIKASELLFTNQVDSVYDAFSACFKEVNVKLSLNAEDINIILDLSKSLGESNIEGHKKIFSLAKTNLKKRLSIAEEAMNKNVKMYRYLGFSLGAMLVIVLV